MNPLGPLKRMFYNTGSRLAIFLVRRRLRKKHQDPGTWLLLARLYEVREAKAEAVDTLQRALSLFPGNKILEMHLRRLQNKARSC